MELRLIITGGTIDKKYNELNGELVHTATLLPEMLKQARSSVKINYRHLMLVDSLVMTDAQRQEIAQDCIGAEEDRIVITHGTDTMVETAQLLGKTITDKTIILTGAMIPYAFDGSDALFNLGSALMAAQTMTSGVYIAMNGQIFEYNNVMKDKGLGEFKLKVAT